MKTTTRAITITAAVACMLGVAGIASADGWRDQRGDVRQIRRTEGRIDHLQNVQRWDINHGRYFAAGVTHEKIVLNREHMRDVRGDLWRDRHGCDF